MVVLKLGGQSNSTIADRELGLEDTTCNTGLRKIRRVCTDWLRGYMYAYIYTYIALAAGAATGAAQDCTNSAAAGMMTEIDTAEEVFAAAVLVAHWKAKRRRPRP